jgi:PKD repeat protein
MVDVTYTILETAGASGSANVSISSNDNTMSGEQTVSVNAGGSTEETITFMGVPDDSYTVVVDAGVGSGQDAVTVDTGGGGGGGTNQQPVAEFSISNTSPQTLELVEFTNQSYDPDGNITSTLWDFGDGSTSASSNPSHTYTDPGGYTVELQVEDDQGAIDETTRTIEVYSDGGGGGQDPNPEFSATLVLIPSDSQYTEGESVQADADIQNTSSADANSAQIELKDTNNNTTLESVTRDIPAGDEIAFLETFTIGDFYNAGDSISLGLYVAGNKMAQFASEVVSDGGGTSPANAVFNTTSVNGDENGNLYANVVVTNNGDEPYTGTIEFTPLANSAQSKSADIQDVQPGESVDVSAEWSSLSDGEYTVEVTEVGGDAFTEGSGTVGVGNGGGGLPIDFGGIPPVALAAGVGVAGLAVLSGDSGTVENLRDRVSTDRDQNN